MAIYEFYINLNIHIFVLYIYTHTYISKVKVRATYLNCIIFALIEPFSLNCSIFLYFVIKPPKNRVKSSLIRTAVFSGEMLE